MPTFVIDARAIKQEDDKLWLDLRYDDRHIEMTALRTQSLEEIAALMLAQAFPTHPDRTLQRRFTVEAHQETVVDPETGTEGQVWVVDSVESAQLPDEVAASEFNSLPGWSTWTGDEAVAWVDGYVVDLDSARDVLAALARAVVLLHRRSQL